MLISRHDMIRHEIALVWEHDHMICSNPNYVYLNLLRLRNNMHMIFMKFPLYIYINFSIDLDLINTPYV